MKNKAIITLIGIIFFAMVLGCSRLVPGSKSSDNPQSGDNKTLTDKGVDVVVGDEKIGVPECDEVVDFFNREIDNPDDDFVTKAVKKTVLNKLKEQFKQMIEENKTDKVELAKTCKEFKKNLDEFKAQQESNKSSNK